jgi:hypothetical protein
MRTTFTVILLFILKPVFSQQDTLRFNDTPENIAAGVKSLEDCNCFIAGMRGQLTEKERAMVIGYQRLYRLDFETLDSLFRNSTVGIQLFTFGVICTNYPERLTADHLALMDNQNKIDIYQQGSTDFPKEKIGDLATGMYDQIAVHEQEKQTELTVQDKISQFIRAYAKYPESYEPMAFEGYHVYSIHDGADLKKQEGSEVYAVMHKYRLKTLKGDVVEVNHSFKMDALFLMMLIEAEESNTVTCYPPRLEFWLGQFGRELTDAEKQAITPEPVTTKVPWKVKREIKRLFK